MKDGQEGLTDKRKFQRIRYPQSSRPVFRVRGQEVQIKDISRGGMRFCLEGPIKARGWVNGDMAFSDGTCMTIEGIVVRIDNKEMGLAFIGELTDEVFRSITDQIAV